MELKQIFSGISPALGDFSQVPVSGEHSSLDKIQLLKRFLWQYD